MQVCLNFQSKDGEGEEELEFDIYAFNITWSFAGRTHINFLDVKSALEELGMDLDQILQLCEADPVPFVTG